MKTRKKRGGRRETGARGGREKIVEANFRRDDDNDVDARDGARRGSESAFEGSVFGSKLGECFEAKAELEFIHLSSIVETAAAV